MNKEWHDFIFSKCDSQQYSLDADDDKCTSLAELERAYRELYTEVYKSKENAHDTSECAEKYKEEVEDFSRQATERVGW